MSGKYRSNSIDSIDSSSYSEDDNKKVFIKTRRRKREENISELSISPPNKINYYKGFLLIFKK